MSCRQEVPLDQVVLDPNSLRICLEYLKDGDPEYPVIVDAGVGGDVAVAMELGVDGVLLNTAIACDDPDDGSCNAICLYG